MLSRRHSAAAIGPRAVPAQTAIGAGLHDDQPRALAQPILEELARSIEAHQLEEWEASDAVAHPLAMLYKCLSKMDGDPAVKQKLYAQISRLDPVQALECARISHGESGFRSHGYAIADRPPDRPRAAGASPIPHHPRAEHPPD